MDTEHQPRLRLVGGEEDDSVEREAARFAVWAPRADQSEVGLALAALDESQLRATASALVAQAHAQYPSSQGEALGPESMCQVATEASSRVFGATPAQIVSSDRHRYVSDARAVAMTAVRRGGLTLPAIAKYFGQHHTTVMYAQQKVAASPRLEAACQRVLQRLERDYPLPKPAPAPESSRSLVRQLGALVETGRPESAHHEAAPMIGRAHPDTTLGR